MSDTKADPTQDQNTGDQDETEQPESGPGAPGSDGGDRGESDESGDGDEAPSAEAYKKLEAKAKRREDKLREAQARIKELEGSKEGEGEEDPEARANAKLVRASAKAVLAGAGITDRAAQNAVLELINLADIEVDDAGDPDEDEITERIEKLRKALGAPQGKPAKRTPAGRTASDRGGSSEGSLTPDQKRYRAFLNS